MKKRFLALLCILFLLSAGCGGGGGAPSDEEEIRLRVVATTYPVYLFTTAVTDGVEGVEVDLLVNQPTSCLHDYTLTINDMKALEGADVIVMNGAGLEDFMADALAASDAAVIDCSAGIELLEAVGHEGHDHAAVQDPHIWMSEEGALAMMDNILRGFGELDGDHLDLYNKNFSAASGLFLEDDTDFWSLSCPYLITFHDGFRYFARDNGLTLLKSIEEEEGSEASAAEIREIISLIEEYEIPAIFTERRGSDATARAIARETGVEVCELDMIMSGSGSGIRPYLDAMRTNYDTIREALS